MSSARIHLVRSDSRPLAGGTTTRRDSVGRWSNPNSGLGQSVDRAKDTEFLPAAPLTTYTIDALLEFQAIARRIVNREPDDAIREGFEVKGNYTPDELRAIMKAIAKVEVLAKVADGRRWAKAYGGAAVILGVEDGAPPWMPINFPGLRRLRTLTALDRHEIWPERWDTNPTSSRFGMPITYMATIQGGGGGVYTGRFHASRVVRFDGTRLPNRRMVARDGWGGSELDLVWESLRNFCAANRFAANAISLLSQGVMKMPGLSKAIQGGDFDQVVDRLEALRLGMGMLGDLALDGEESYEIHERSFSGLAPTLDKLADAMLADTEMPKTILMGQQPSGLNATADAETRSWYDHVGSKQVSEYDPPTLYILEVMCRALEGPTRGRWDPDTAIEWLPLYQQTDQERAQTRLTNAQARALDMSSGVASAEEVRRDPDLAEAYPGFDPSDPPPPPPEPAPSNMAPADNEDEPDDVIIPADPSEQRPGEPLISAREVATMLGWNTTQPVISMAVAGDVPAWKVRGRWRFQASTVREYISSRSNMKGDRAPLPLA